MKTILMIAALILTTQASQAQTRFQTLKEKFDQSKETLTVEDLNGTYLGRCFAPQSEEPSGMLLTTRKITFVKGDNSGPMFPPIKTDKWLMSEAAASFLGIMSNAEDNDSTTAESMDSFWEKYKDTALELKINSNTATISSVRVIEDFVVNRPVPKAPVTFSVRKNADGYLYATEVISLKKDNKTIASYNLKEDIEFLNSTCYFFKKLF